LGPVARLGERKEAVKGKSGGLLNWTMGRSSIGAEGETPREPHDGATGLKMEKRGGRKRIKEKELAEMVPEIGG